VEGSFTYVDKIAQASSKDLALYYIRDALRDYASLMASDKVSEFPQAKALADSLSSSDLEKDVGEIEQINSVPELREYLSYVASEALIQATTLGNRQLYDLAVKIRDYLGFSPVGEKPSGEEVEKLSNEIKQKAREIASALDVTEEDVLAVAKNKNILWSVLKKKG